MKRLCQRSLLLRRALVLLTASILAACNPEAAYDVLREVRKPNTTLSQFVGIDVPCSPVRAPAAGGKALIVFVHGALGDTLGTWTHASGTPLFDLVRTNPNFCQQYDILPFGFVPELLKAGSFSIPEAAAVLNRELEFKKVFDNYDRIVFVVHSMGGLVTLEFLMIYPEIADKVPLVFTYATPYSGSQVAELGFKVLKNSALAGMVA